MDKRLIDRNVTTIFLLWTVGLNYAECFHYGMVDAFIGDVNHPNYYGYYIYVLVDSRLKRIEKDSIFDNNLLMHQYNYGKQLTVYKYQFPIEFRDDYDKIVSGKYSLVSNEFKSKFPEKQLNLNSQTNKSFYQNDIAHKYINRFWYIKGDYEKLIKAEVRDEDEWWKPFDMEKEVLNILNYL